MPREEPDAGRLYDQFGASLYRYALMLLASREAAEDVVQQVFVAMIHRGLGGVDDPERYLRRSVRNACYSALRERASAGLSNGADPLLEAVAGQAQPIGEEIRLALGAAIGRLPADQREVLHLHLFEGRTFREIAEIACCPLNTAASRYRYALERLRAELAERRDD